MVVRLPIRRRTGLQMLQTHLVAIRRRDGRDSSVHILPSKVSIRQLVPNRHKLSGLIPRCKLAREAKLRR